MRQARYQPQSRGRPARGLVGLTGLFNFTSLYPRNLVNGRAVIPNTVNGNPVRGTAKGLGVFSNTFAPADSAKFIQLESGTNELVTGTDAMFVWFGHIVDRSIAGVMARGDDFSGNGSSLRMGVTTAGEAIFSYVSTAPAAYTATTSGANIQPNEFVCIVGIKRGTTVEVYCKGKFASASGGTGTLRTSGRGVSVGFFSNSNLTNASGGAAVHQYAAVFNRAGSPAEAFAYSQNPLLLFAAPEVEEEAQEAAAPPDVTGSASTALAGSSLSSIGAVTNSGAMSAQLASAQLSLAGGVAEQPSGSFSSALTGVSFSAVGALLAAGAMSSNLAGVNAVFAGNVASPASGDLTTSLQGAQMAAYGFEGDAQPVPDNRRYRPRILRRHFTN